MSRWIAFDRQSAAVLATAQIVPELHDAGDALGAALSSGKDTVVLLPAPAPGRALVARIRHVPVVVREQAPEVYEATGFLGLIDLPPAAQQPHPPKKWWQKLLD